MQVQENKSLKTYNTFGIDAKAKFFCEINSMEDLAEALKLDEYSDKFILSGGSNMLITKDIEALVLHINLKGISILEEDEGHVLLKVMAGENWHQMVLWTLEHDYGGLENMSLIPGWKLLHNKSELFRPPIANSDIVIPISKMQEKENSLLQALTCV